MDFHRRPGEDAFEYYERVGSEVSKHRCIKGFGVERGNDDELLIFAEILKSASHEEARTLDLFSIDEIRVINEIDSVIEL